jgi:hypothetical protein
MEGPRHPRCNCRCECDPRDVPRLQTAVFVVSFDAGESKTRKELHKHTLRPYHDTISTKGYHSASQTESYIPIVYPPVIVDGLVFFSAMATIHSSARRYAFDKPQPDG